MGLGTGPVLQDWKCGYKMYPRVRSQLRLSVSRRGAGFGFTGCPIFGPVLYPDCTLPVLKLGFRGPFGFSSLAAPCLLGSSPLVEATAAP